MLGKSHAVVGFTATAAALFAMGIDVPQDLPVTVVALGIGTLAALLPDIDSPNATIRTTFGVGRSQSYRALRTWHRKNLAEIVLDIIQWWIARFLDIVHHLLPHRGPTHWGITWISLTAALGVVCYFFGLPPQLWVAFGVGYGSHLVTDGMTVSGVKLYAPLYKRSVRFIPRPLSFRTGSWQESMTVSLMMITAVMLVFVYYVLY